MISFWIFAKLVAIDLGVLPPDARLERVLNRVPLEVGLITGGVIALLGAVTAGLAVVDWMEAGFGALAPGHAIRLVIVGTTAIVLGAQIIFGSFFRTLLEQTRSAR